MKRLFIFLFINVLISISQLSAQSFRSIDDWMEYWKETTSETEDVERMEALYTELSYLSEHPLDLNVVTEQQLKKIPFLSDLQIKEIVKYRIRYGKMATIYELKNIESMDRQTISLLMPFVYVGELNVDKLPFSMYNLLNKGHNDLYISYDKCFQHKEGYSSYPDSILAVYPNKTYMGEPFYHALRYTYTFDDRLQLGIIAEKDAGEPFWNRFHKGYDFYAAHLMMKEVNKWLKTVAIGDYKVSFGQGLVINNGFSPGKSALVTQIENRTNGFRRHFSTNESNFMRGAATTFSLKNADLHFFYSYRKMDAVVDSHLIRSFKTDGLHRLIREKEQKNNVSMQVIGGNMRWYIMPDLYLGTTALTYSFGRLSVQSTDRPYNLFYFRGNHHTNVSIDYLFKKDLFKLYGETALSANGKMAALHTFSLTPVSYFEFVLSYRYYDKQYHAFFGNSLSQNRLLQNEKGLYMGMKWTVFPHGILSAYSDLYRFPWLTYQKDHPAEGMESMIRFDYTPNDRYMSYIRYKYRKEEEIVRRQVRWQQIWMPFPFLSLRTSCDFTVYNSKKRSTGWMLAQHVDWKSPDNSFLLNWYGALFHTGDSYSRIYSYEKNLLYTFNVPSFYGKGFRMACSFRWNIGRVLALSAKVGGTYYTDRQTIGTGLEKITSPYKLDLSTMIHWKF